MKGILMVQDHQDSWHGERHFKIRRTPTIGDYVEKDTDEYVFERLVDHVERITIARDKFFEWAHSGNANADDMPGSAPCLWGFFGTWIAYHWIYDLHGEKPVWLNPTRREEVWAEFLPLVPLIYLAVIDEAIQNPSKLSFLPAQQLLAPSTLTVLPSWRYLEPTDPRITPENRQFEPLVQMVLGGYGSWPPLVERPG